MIDVSASGVALLVPPNAIDTLDDEDATIDLALLENPDALVARIALDLCDVYMNNDASVAQALDRCKHVSLYLLERADAWLDDEDDDDII